jgi:PEP-CTERM motif
MKVVVVLLAAIAFASVAAQGQGQFSFNTHDVAAGNVLYFVNDAGPATGNDLFLEVFAGPDAAHLTPLTPLLALNGTGAAAGYANPSSATYTVPGITAGQSAVVAYVGFQGPNEMSAIFTTGRHLAMAAVVLTDPTTPPNEVLLGTHTLFMGTIPEPSTWAMFLVGLGGIMFAVARPQQTAASND